GRWTQRYEYDRYGNRRNVYSKPVEQFVRDFYQGALARQPNSTELQTWTDSLRLAYPQGQGPLLTEAKELGRALFQSAEYAARNRTDRDFVADLYRGYLQRAPDQAGWDYWTGVVATAGREAVRQSFEGSAEFDYGVNGLSPLAPASGVPVGRDGLAGPVFFDAATNRVNAAGWQYDAAGNQTRVQVAPGVWQRMVYDFANRLVSVKTDAGAVIATHTYADTGNSSLVTQEGATRTYYARAGASIIAQYGETDGTATASSPQWSKNYIYLDGRLLATQQPSGAGEQVEYHHPDRLGTRLVSNAANTSFYEQATLPFGTGLSAESTGASNRRFTSYDRSPATGLDYAVNRYYDSTQGRFTQADPIGMGAADLDNPQTLNMYAYCGNDPVNNVDPDGQFFKKLFRFFKKLLNILKWVVVAVVVAIAVLTFLPGGAAILAGIYKALGAIGLTSVLAYESGGIAIEFVAGVLVAADNAVGAISRHVNQKEPGKTRRRREKAERRQERERRSRVRINPPLPQPQQGERRVEVRPKGERPPEPKMDPDKPKLPENPTTKQKVKYAVSRILRFLTLWGSRATTLVMMTDPALIAERACRENPGGALCEQYEKFLSPEKFCEIMPWRCA
ncbi:MAG: DUF4214 domain-containing protein, partial [Acidobacteriota bacterium]|nr:DUF4214 domain-containing protein [Acidobacteriota bacterium]